MAITVKAPFQKNGLGGSVQELIEKSTDLRQLMLGACERGLITVDQINAALLNDDISPDLLEELMGTFDELGVKVIGGDDSEKSEAKEASGGSCRCSWAPPRKDSGKCSIKFKSTPPIFLPKPPQNQGISAIASSVNRTAVIMI